MSNSEKPIRRFWLSDIAVLLYLSFTKLLIHLLTNHQYGYQRDEFYFIECARHLDFGYVDHPPMIAYITKLSLLCFGDSVRALRFFSALTGAAKVFLTGMLVREMGGGRFAQITAVTAFIISPVYLVPDTLLCIPAFEQLWWMLGFYVLLRIIQNPLPILWLLFGLIVGLGLLTKHSMLFFGFGLALGLLFTPHRKLFLDRWFWISGATALLLFLPNLIWQVQNGWPTLEFMRNLSRYNLNRIALPEFLLGQILYVGPINFPLWFIGLVSLFFIPRQKPFRLFGWMYGSVVILLAVLKSKIYYTAPLYPLLFASGALTIEQWTSAAHRWLRPVLIGILLVGGVPFFPLSLPILPIQTFMQYIGFFAKAAPNAYELRYGFADMFGWENQVVTVAQVYNSLLPTERMKCTILAGNYGEAGALNFFGPQYQLPKAISPHMTYHLWGPGETTFETIIAIGVSYKELSNYFDKIEQAAFVTNEYAVPYENHLPVFICRNPKKDLHAAWPYLKRF